MACSNDGSRTIHHPHPTSSSSTTGLVVGSESEGSGGSIQRHHPAIARTVLASPASSQVCPSDDNANAHHRRDGVKRRRTSSPLQDSASVKNDCRDDIDEEITIGRGRVRHGCLLGRSSSPTTMTKVGSRNADDAEKSEWLDRIPKEIKSRFRECGFSKWGKEWLPVLELGPFDVEPGPVRDMWFEMFRNVSFHVRLGWKLYVLQRLRFISVILYHQ